VSAAAQPGASAGQYRATVTLPHAGAWTITVYSGFGNSNVTLLPLPAVGPGRAVAAVAAAERGRQLFVAKGCLTCHLHPEVSGSGVVKVGPDMTGRRFTGDYLQRHPADLLPPRWPGETRCPTEPLAAGNRRWPHYQRETARRRAVSSVLNGRCPGSFGPVTRDSDYAHHQSRGGRRRRHERLRPPGRPATIARDDLATLTVPPAGSPRGLARLAGLRRHAALDAAVESAAGAPLPPSSARRSGLDHRGFCAATTLTGAGGPADRVTFGTATPSRCRSRMAASTSSGRRTAS
jgi:hypothetical protein